jgi:glycosidase
LGCPPGAEPYSDLYPNRAAPLPCSRTWVVSHWEQQRYFDLDGGDGVQMLFDFRTCAAQWLPHARGSAEPIIGALNSRPRHPPHAQFANFCRHHDELNLGMLSDREREEVFAAFAPEPAHRLYGRSIRRRLAPMLGGDRRRIRLALALTMALPGTPVLMYGDEIGMGEDLSLPGRIAVRNPMQWSPRHAGGFSTADQLYRPSRAEGPFGYRAVNVLDQRHQPGSLYSWVAHAIRVRRECPELGWGQWRTLEVGDPRVLGIAARWRDGRIVTLHNLSAEPATVRLPGDLDEWAQSKTTRCARSSATPNPRTAPARRSRSAVTDSAGCDCRIDGGRGPPGSGRRCHGGQRPSRRVSVAEVGLKRESGSG